MEHLAAIITACGSLVISIATLITAFRTKKENKDVKEQATQATANLQEERQRSQQATIGAEQAIKAMDQLGKIYESTVHEQERQINKLKESEQDYHRSEKERAYQFTRLQEQLMQCEARSAQAEIEASKLQREVISLKTTNADMTIQVHSLIGRIDQLLEESRVLREQAARKTPQGF